MRQELRVDVQLANTAGDQLGELAAEVEDDDRVRLDGSVAGGSLRSRRVERGLEIGLDLGVIGGEDAVAGVRGLAVDGLAALGWRGRWLRWCRLGPDLRLGLGFTSISSAISSAGCGSSTTIDRPPPRSASDKSTGADPQSRFRIASAAMSK